MLKWIKAVATDALRLSRQATRDDQTDHAARLRREIEDRQNARWEAMREKVGQPAEPRVGGACYPLVKF